MEEIALFSKPWYAEMLAQHSAGSSEDSRAILAGLVMVTEAIDRLADEISKLDRTLL